MKCSLLVSALCASTTVSHATDTLMQDFGAYSFVGSGYSVQIELTEVEKGKLAPKITWHENGKLASTGIGEGSSISVVPGRWAAEFRPPRELWIYDGRKHLQLYERTTNPNGFKASSSALVPELHSRVPETLEEGDFVQLI